VRERAYWEYVRPTSPKKIMKITKILHGELVEEEENDVVPKKGRAVVKIMSSTYRSKIST